MNQKYRGIVRLSYNNDAGSKFRNKVVPLLESANFENTKTGVWETKSENFSTIQAQLNLFMEELAKAMNEESEFILDHVWIYIDSITSSEPIPLE